MIKENFEYLKNSLKYLGFGDSLNSALEANLKGKHHKFNIGASAFFDTPSSIKDKNVKKDSVDYTLHFSKSKVTEHYFLNSYSVSLNKDHQLKEQVFSLNKGQDITAKEAYNLLSGRSVLKKAVLADKLIIKEGSDPFMVAKDLNEAVDHVKAILLLNPQNNIQIVDKNNTILREYSPTGKELDIKRNNLKLIHSFIQMNDKGFDDIPYEVKDMAGARTMINQLVKYKNTKGFSISENGNVFLSFDKDGKELPYRSLTSKVNVWVKLDLDKKLDNGNYKLLSYHERFNVSEELDKLKILEATDHHKRDILIASLNRGNLQAVNIDTGNGDYKQAYISANPNNKTLDLFDKDMNSLSLNGFVNKNESTTFHVKR